VLQWCADKAEIIWLEVGLTQLNGTVEREAALDMTGGTLLGIEVEGVYGRSLVATEYVPVAGMPRLILPAASEIYIGCRKL
jgi:hypothetical protein